jgi:nucleotide-binding universal stress UspA family protein
MIKDIVVNLDVESAQSAVADYAISVAQAFDAHLSAVAFAYEEALPASIFSRVAIELIEAQRRKCELAAESAAGKFDESARGSGVSAESHIFKSGIANAAEHFGRLARRYDLAVVSQVEADKLPMRELIIHAALFDSGRPVLIVPYIQRDGLKLDRVMVCWDGSRNAARAMGDAMPFLARAKAVEIVLVAGDPGKSNEIAGVDVAHHLARHQLKVELRQIVVRDLDVANTILSHAADAGTDFIVMGGYGHSRLREFVLGGATRGILAAMTVPTFMSH